MPLLLHVFTLKKKSTKSLRKLKSPVAATVTAKLQHQNSVGRSEKW